MISMADLGPRKVYLWARHRKQIPIWHLSEHRSSKSKETKKETKEKRIRHTNKQASKQINKRTNKETKKQINKQCRRISNVTQCRTGIELRCLFFFWSPAMGGEWGAMRCRVRRIASYPLLHILRATYILKADAHASAGLASRGNLPVWGVWLLTAVILHGVSGLLRPFSGTRKLTPAYGSSPPASIVHHAKVKVLELQESFAYAEVIIIDNIS